MNRPADEATSEYLKSHGFDSPEEWALDQGLTYDKHHDRWYDDERKPVDLDKRLHDTMMDDAYRYLDSLY